MFGCLPVSLSSHAPAFSKAVFHCSAQFLRKQNSAEKAPPGCNCRGGTVNCPLDGKCLDSALIYKATVTEADNTTNTYTGLTKNTFKERYYGHTNSFKKRKKEHSTTLSTHIWKLKDQDKNYDIKWSVIDRGKPFNPITRKCYLCMKEKFNILHHPAGSSLNTRSELFSTCKHRCDKLLINI